MPSILIVEDELILAKNVRDKLEASGHRVAVVHSGEEAVRALPGLAADIVLMDVRLPGMDGVRTLERLRAESPSTCYIIMTAFGSERVAVEAMRAGAFDYLSKPIDFEELGLVVERATEHQQMSENLSFLRTQEERVSGLDRIMGDSQAILNVKGMIRRLTQTDVIGLPDPPSVLITGETGTGKDLVARAIHYEGPRRAKPFIHVNCTALPAPLFESELFGHVAGAFTGATRTKRGLFEVAHGGTIFLDEVGHIAPETQAKLLHTLERREIRPVGATDNRSVNVHILAATNRNLSEAVNKGEFRRDLYHRLRVLEIHVPSLRDRGDIMTLAEHFLPLHSRRFGSQARSFAPDARECLRRYTWPGNVRELSHVIESAVLHCDGPIILCTDLRLQEPPHSDRVVSIEMPAGRTVRLDFESGEPTLDEVEQTILRTAFEYCNQNLSRAARVLGITREALRYRLNKGAQAAESGEMGCPPETQLPEVPPEVGGGRDRSIPMSS